MLAIAHLSDIHFRTTSNLLLGRVEQIKLAVRSQTLDVTSLLLVISGDIAYSGKTDEYSIAVGFLAELEAALKGIEDVEFLGTILVPGNHDCEFDKDDDLRSTLLANLGAKIDTIEPTGQYAAELLSVQKHFFEFYQLLEGEKSHIAPSLAWLRSFDSPDGKVVFRCLNTAWTSRTKEQAGQLYFPATMCEEPVDADLVVTVLHHPYNWLEPMNNRAVRRAVELNSDIVLTGHEHEGETFIKTSATGAITHFVEGAALQDQSVETGFNIIKIDLVVKIFKVIQCHWAKDFYKTSEPFSAPFIRNQNLLQHQFVNMPEFRNFLDDIGTPFTHRVKPKLQLTDLFVYPDMRVSKIEGGLHKSTAILKGQNLVEFAFVKRKIQISGAANAGKTALSKQLYVNLRQEKQLIPVYIDGSEFKGTTIDSVLAAMIRVFKKQYPARLLDKFNQLDREDKVVIVDDWHKVPFNNKGKVKILEALEKMAARIILFTDDSAVLQSPDNAEVLALYEQCEIKPFGYRLRSELVRKWETLGKEFELDDFELTRSINNNENLLDTLIGKGIVPSYPFFVFSVLQAEDVMATNPSYGSFGHIYEALLTRRIARVSSKQIGPKFTYLSLIAEKMFVLGRDYLEPSEMEATRLRYEHEYLVSPNEHGWLKEFHEAHILRTVSDQTSFVYGYAFYFFLAFYFHDGISNVKETSRLRLQLRELVDAAHDEEKTHILIFYLYLSKDRELIEYILQRASKTFSSLAECNLNTDVDFANAICNSHPRLLTPDSDISANRTDHRAKKDERAEEYEDEPSSENPVAREIDAGVHLLTVMGQVVRNFPGDLRGDLTIRLVDASYSLALRLLKGFVSSVEKDTDSIRRTIIKSLKAEDAFSRKEDSDLLYATNMYIVGLVELAVFGVIKKVALTVGHEDLQKTYHMLKEKADGDDVGRHLIDLAIRLEHFARIPVHDVEKLKQKVEKNVVVYTALRLLVMEFLSLFPCDYKLKQKVEAMLEFQPSRAAHLVERRIRTLPAAR